MKSLREQAIENRKYPDGTKIPKNLPPKYSLAKGKENCANCEYYNSKTKNCSKWDAIVRPAYWCAKWEAKEAGGE